MKAIRPLIIGIDPGVASGAISVVNMDTMTLVDCQCLPVYRRATRTRRQGYFSMLDINAVATMIGIYAEDTALAILEEPGAMPNQGLSSTFRFGHACGQIHGALAASCITTMTVKPQVWKPALGLSQIKMESIDKAKMMFPAARGRFTLKKDHDKAEATLLAIYGLKYFGHVIKDIRSGHAYRAHMAAKAIEPNAKVS